ncbi:MAG: zinc ribbon domain-containing protein [Anaerolineaceae bacterium]|nr:zinc ribbon domain-containing protein [Anaerolineaceae bacterium]
MDNFLGRIRSGAEHAAGKATFEADKLRRVTVLQGKVRSLKGDFEKKIVETGQTAFALHQQEQITGPESLRQACAQLASIQTQITLIEQQIEEIRAETFEGPQAKPQYGRVCPNGHGAIPTQDNFCQVCGAKAIEVPPPGSVLCPNCGASLALGARFCAECGHEVKQMPPLAGPSGKACANCGALLLPDSTFCTECGHQVVAASPQPTPDESVAEDIKSAGLPEDIDQESSQTELEGIETEVLETLQVEDVVFGSEVAETAISPKPEETATGNCPVCEAPLVLDALFCTECGHRFGQKDGKS